MLLLSDAAQIPLPDKSIHCVTTSPPYWGLRKYSGIEGRGKFTNLGLEPTPEEFVHNMVAIFREVRRVLRDDGVVWMNLGDCFAGSGGMGGGRPGDKQWTNLGSRTKRPASSIAQGNLMMMPHRVAIALQDDGWVIRNDVVWFKRNPMPESLNGWRFQRERSKSKDGNTAIGKLEREEGKASWTVFSGQGTRREGLVNPEYEYGEDYELRKGSWRHTRAHEYVFMLSKDMKYWSNQEAVREGFETNSKENYPARSITLERSGQGFAEARGGDRGQSGGFPPSGPGRNPRSVLDVPTAPYKGAHYATFPPNLIAPLIRATCPRWACPVCGQGWSPVVDKQKPPSKDTRTPGEHTPTGDGKLSGAKLQEWFNANPPQIKEYRPTCFCCKICQENGLSIEEMEKHHGIQRQRKRAKIQKGMETEKIQNRSRIQKQGSPQEKKISSDLPKVRKTLQGKNKRIEILFSILRRKSSLGKRHRKQNASSWKRATLKYRKSGLQTQNDKGTSSSDGRTTGQETSTRRTHSSYQREQKRQPNRKFNDRIQKRTRQNTQSNFQEHKIQPFTIDEAVPGIVLDPFLGSGTTGMVARELQRRWIGLDISMEYIDLQAKVRTKSGSPSNYLEGLPLFEKDNDNVD